MAAMTPESHDHWRGLIALAALDALDPADRPSLDAHLASCPSCADDAAELQVVGAALAFADLDAVVVEQEPLPTPVPAVRAARRRRRRVVAVALGAVAAVGAALGLAVSLPGGSRAVPTRLLALHGSPGVVAEARLRGEPWGTSIEIVARGQTPGQMLTVSMGTAGGRWWSAGSYRSALGTTHVTLACAVRVSLIASVRVSDASGQLVLASTAPGWPPSTDPPR